MSTTRSALIKSSPRNSTKKNRRVVIDLTKNQERVISSRDLNNNYRKGLSHSKVDLKMAAESKRHEEEAAMGSPYRYKEQQQNKRASIKLYRKKVIEEMNTRKLLPQTAASKAKMMELQKSNPEEFIQIKKQSRISSSPRASSSARNGRFSVRPRAPTVRSISTRRKTPSPPKRKTIRSMFSDFFKGVF
jgi:hypothetical protein